MGMVWYIYIYYIYVYRRMKIHCVRVPEETVVVISLFWMVGHICE